MRLPYTFLNLVIIVMLINGCSIRGGSEKLLVFEADEIVKDWVTLWNTYDLSMLESIFLNDSRLTYFSSEKQGLIKGFEAVRKHHIGFGFVAGGKAHDNKLWLEGVESQTIEDMLIVEAIWYFQKKVEGSVVVTKGPVTFVYVAEDGAYKIVHVHFANYQ